MRPFFQRQLFVRRSELQRPPNGRIDLVGTLRREWWQGEERLSFHVKDFRNAERGTRNAE